VQKGCIRYARPATFTSLNADVATRALHKGDETKLDFFLNWSHVECDSNFQAK
jgi:hypothetical protein